jgi:serine phosphatase RsbU (regulator of sigma subunit)/ligand-binding sensor domain-containing protein
MKKGFIIVLLIIPFLGFNQVNKYGFPFYKYYGMEEYNGTEQNWAIVKDNRGLLYIGNNDKGVLQYDGTTWRQIPIQNNSIVRSLAADKKGVIYVGAVGEFGNLLPNKSGLLSYQSLLPKIDSIYHPDITDVWKTYVTDSIIYFCTQSSVYKYYTEQDTVKSIKLPKYSGFSHLLDDKLYIGGYYEGLSRHIKDTVFVSLNSERLKPSNVFVLEKLNDSIALIGTVSKGLFKLRLSDHNVLDANCSATSDYLKDNKLYQAEISNNFSAFATLNGGVLVTKDMMPYETYGSKSGLPTDERVAYVYSDNNIKTPLWAALNNGIIRLDWHLPFRVMDDRNGLSGHVSDIMRYNEKLYVATSSGLFVLKYGNSGPYFSIIPDLEQQVWNLHKFKYPKTNKEVLFVGTIRGLYQLDEKQNLTRLEKQIVNISDPDKEYYVFYIGHNDTNPNEIFIGTRNGIKKLRFTNNKWFEYEIDFLAEVRTIVHDGNGYWMGTSFKGVAYLGEGLDSVKFYGKGSGLNSLDQNFAVKVNDELAIINPSGVYKFDAVNDKFVADERIGKIAVNSKMGISKLVKDKNHFYLNMYSDELQRIRRINIDGNYSEYDTAIFNRLPNVQFDAIYPDGDIVWLGSSRGLFAFMKNTDKKIFGKDFNTLIREVTLNRDSILIGGAYLTNDGVLTSQPQNQDFRLSYSSNDIEFKFSAPFFEGAEEMMYSYILEGYDKSWSPWSFKTEEDYNNLPSGDYVFKVKAKNIYGFESNSVFSEHNTSSFAFRVLPPWYITVYAIIGYFILLALLVRFIVQWRTRKLKLEKERLERIVEERTAEIMEKKDEIEKQRDEIAEKNQSITDSIHYASRIQQALLPSEKMLKDSVPDHFVLFKPRDIVSGDYYWMTSIENKAILVAADCTGHGVPGAFMSMLGMSFLNEIVNKNVTTEAGEILDQLRAHVIDALKQEGDDVKAKDGMDLALYVIDKENNTIHFAGANNPLYIIREQTDEEKQAIKDGDEKKLPKRPVYDDTHILQEIKADKMPIGIHIKNHPFETKTIPIQKGMQLYTFSDGYVDQFGGPKRRKFMSKAFKQLLIKIYHKPMLEQRQILDETIIKWIEDGNEIQVDDIIVLGVRIV